MTLKNTVFTLAFCIYIFTMVFPLIDIEVIDYRAAAVSPTYLYTGKKGLVRMATFSMTASLMSSCKSLGVETC